MDCGASRSSRARTRLTTRAMRRCSAAPALALTAAGLRGAERRSVRMTPSTPAPSATRNRAPQVLGVFHAVECQQEAGVPGGRQRLEEVFDSQELLRADHGDNALVGGGAGKLGQLVPCSCRTRTPDWRHSAIREARRSSLRSRATITWSNRRRPARRASSTAWTP